MGTVQGYGGSTSDRGALCWYLCYYALNMASVSSKFVSFSDPVNLYLLRYGPESPDHVPNCGQISPKPLLAKLKERAIPIENVVADRVFDTSEEAAQVIKILSKAAADSGFHDVVNLLGQTEALGSHYQDIYADIPEATPVMRPKVSKLQLSPGIWNSKR